MPHHAGHQENEQMRKCIQVCTDCHHVCSQTQVYCLRMGGKHADSVHVGLLRNCAEICQTSADFMLGGSDLQGRLRAACAEVCERCVQSCEKFSGDTQMMACADACRRCAESCRQMSS
jgi:hypothetical protein